ncbi:hypothetical protein KR009_005628 [Drosophila setifemur]|nr:hypothetical protein KR009_005628 [Drosophila setifemur]
MYVNAANAERPIYLLLQQLSDAQISLMCETHGIFLGQIDQRNRSVAERQLHVALIEERAKFRAKEQFAQECYQRLTPSTSFNPSTPPPQEHYATFDPVPPKPRQTIPKRTYWPVPGSNLRNPIPSPSRCLTRLDSVLKPQQCPIQKRGPNILGVRVPFSMTSARQFSSKMGHSLKRYTGGGEDLYKTVRFKDEEAVQEEDAMQEEDCQIDKQLEEYLDILEDTYQDSYQDSESDVASDASVESFHKGPNYLHYCKDFEHDTLSQRSEYDEYFQQKLQSTIGEKQQDQQQASDPVRDLQVLASEADTQSRSEFASLESTPSVYHDFLSQVNLPQALPEMEATPRFRFPFPFHWWWWPWRIESTGRGCQSERIPEAERTRERLLDQEHELQTIHYLREPGVEDAVLELMAAAQLRDDSDEEVQVLAEELGQGGRLATASGNRSYSGFGPYIFRLFCCDRQGKLDLEKLRCCFLCCCLAIFLYQGFKRMR